MPHADDARLQAYLDGELRWLGDEPEALERHLEGCAHCQARLEEVRRLREQARALLGNDLPVERPPFETVLLRARGESGGVVRRRVPAAVWAASLVLALAGGWLARGLVPGGDRGSDGEGVRVSTASAPAPAPTSGSATAAQPEVAADPSSPGGAVAEPSPPTAAPPEAGVPRTSDPAGLAASTPPRGQSGERQRPAAADRPAVPPDESRTLAAASTPAVQPDESRPLAAASTPAAQPGAVQPLAAAAPSRSHEGGGVEMIQGRVTDERGRVIAGAAIQIPGMRVGTLTGADGTYSLAVPHESAGTADGLVVTASALGWEFAAEAVASTRDRAVTRDFQLRPAQVALEGVVAVGLSTANRTSAAALAFDEGRAGRWAPATQEEIRRLLGRDALRIAGPRVLEIAIGRVNGIRAVRVRQELAGGGVATLLQWADPRGEDRDYPGVAQKDRPPSRDQPGRAEAEAAAWRDGLRVVARGPISADSLATLLDRLR